MESNRNNVKQFCTEFSPVKNNKFCLKFIPILQINIYLCVQYNGSKFSKLHNRRKNEFNRIS